MYTQAKGEIVYHNGAYYFKMTVTDEKGNDHSGSMMICQEREVMRELKGSVTMVPHQKKDDDG